MVNYDSLWRYWQQFDSAYPHNNYNMKTKRVKKRLQNYYDAISIMRIKGVSLGAAKQVVKYGTLPPWRDSSSPTGWMQECDYMGNCQFPCNGDC